MRKQRILLFLLSLCLANGIKGQDTCVSHTSFGISFPPVGNSLERLFSKQHLDTLNVSRMRFETNWSLREPSDGIYNWAPFDQRIDWVDSNNYSLLFTLTTDGPTWACDTAQMNSHSCIFLDTNQFRTFTDTLAQRYAGRIDKAQFGNEWQVPFWFIGNASQYSTYFNIFSSSFRTYSPTTEIVLGGFTHNSQQWLAACNGYLSTFTDGDGFTFNQTEIDSVCASQDAADLWNRIDSVLTLAQYDLIDIHLYDDVENWPLIYRNIDSIVTKPIIVSEFGGPNNHYEPLDDNYQANRVFQYVKTIDSLNIDEAYFFKLVESTSANPAHLTSGLIDDTTLIRKKAYDVFESFGQCVTAVESSEPLNEWIKVYPNPNEGSFKVRNIGFNIYLLRILNSMGKKIGSRNIASDSLESFDISKYPSGVYLLQFVNDTHSGTIKLIKY